MHKFNDLDTFYDQQAIGNVRRLVQQLREAALSPIPDLDAVSPPEGWKVGDKKLDAWAKKAEARALEVVQWRRRVEALIGDIDEGHRGEEEPGIGQVLVPNDQTLLGLFHAAVPDGVIRRADGSVKELAYVPGSHPILYLGNARLYLGVPPAHLVWPAHYNRLNGAAPLGRNNWPEYGEILLSQALLARTRALELCAWCEQRINQWENAFLPSLRFGPGTENYGKHSAVISLAASTSNRLLKPETGRALGKFKKEGKHEFDSLTQLKRFRDDLPEIAPFLQRVEGKGKGKVVRALPAMILGRIEPTTNDPATS